MFTLDPARSWTPFQKIGFRLVFLCLGLLLLDYEIGILFIDLNLFSTSNSIYASFAPALSWLDQHLYHIGYNRKLHGSFPGDTYFGMAYYSTIILVSGFIVIIWSLIDRNKKEYNCLNYWFRLYIRYIVALIVFSYGITKVFPVQMSYPRVTQLLTPMGEEGRFDLLWNFMGASPGYETFTGICEVTASLLLIFNRTYIAGSLLMCAVLSNVVALNYFYDVSVLVPSSLLLVSMFYLLAPYIRKLFRFFFQFKQVSLSEKHYRFESGWKKYVAIGLGIGIPLSGFLNSSYEAHKIYHQVKAEAQDQKLYDVTYFITNDTLQPLLTDTLRWRRFVLLSKNSAAVYNMQDGVDYYDCDMDSVNRTCRLHDNSDSTKWDVFHYSNPQRNLLTFTGSWKGNKVNILMKQIPIDSMRLNKEKFIFLQD